MATLHSFKDNSTACFANIRMENGEPVYIGVAQSGVIVKKSRFGLFGQKLFESMSPEHAIKTAYALDQTFPVQSTPATMINPVLKAYCNAVLHCRSADEVANVVNRPVDMRNGKDTSPNAEIARSRLMGDALRRAVVWGVIAEIVWVAAYLAVNLAEGKWADDAYSGLLVFPLVTAGYFMWKRRSILDDFNWR